MKLEFTRDTPIVPVSHVLLSQKLFAVEYVIQNLVKITISSKLPLIKEISLFFDWLPNWDKYLDTIEMSASK